MKRFVQPLDKRYVRFETALKKCSVGKNCLNQPFFSLHLASRTYSASLTALHAPKQVVFRVVLLLRIASVGSLALQSWCVEIGVNESYHSFQAVGCVEPGFLKQVFHGGSSCLQLVGQNDPPVFLIIKCVVAAYWTEVIDFSI